jgi:hypothetical protein
MEYTGGWMISFASLFVGFVIGIVNVELMASGGVDRVALFLDGRQVAKLREPFRAPLDLGCDPAPHELVAVAYDAHGKELDRARQLINLPRPTAEASLVLEEGRGGTGRVARLTWRALAGEAPTALSVTFDGLPIAAGDPHRIELPPHELAQVHFLRADLEFGKGGSASAELIFGGSRRSEAQAELTAIAVEVEKEASLPPAGELAGWLEAGGVPLEVAAVEDVGIDVVFVVEGSAVAQLRRLVWWSANDKRRSYDLQDAAEGPSSKPTSRRWGDRSADRTLFPADLRYRILWPIGRMTTQTEMVANVYPTTPWVFRGGLDARRLVARPGAWPVPSRTGQRLADAVAVAGLAAAEGNRRRAVVLVLGPDAKDEGLLAAEEAVRFLTRLGIPLEVWSVGRKHSREAARWRPRRLISEEWEFDGAVRELLVAADRQRIVWVEGSYLPQDVTVTPLARGIGIAQ